MCLYLFQPINGHVCLHTCSSLTHVRLHTCSSLTHVRLHTCSSLTMATSACSPSWCRRLSSSKYTLPEQKIRRRTRSGHRPAAPVSGSTLRSAAEHVITLRSAARHHSAQRSTSSLCAAQHVITLRSAAEHVIPGGRPDSPRVSQLLNWVPLGLATPELGAPGPHLLNWVPLGLT